MKTTTHSSRGGKWCLRCGVTAGRISRAYADGSPLECLRPDTPCGHPLAARAIEVYAIGPKADDRRLRTYCWACRADAEYLAAARRPWDNTGVGSSDESNTIANGARVLATTHDAGVTAFRGSSS